MSLVLVTGGTGFIGCHCVVQLLRAGHQVRTTVRNLAREGGVRAMVKTGGAEAGNNLSFAAADLTKDEGWARAVAGCDYVLHVASPIADIPKHEDDLIIPARDGTLRVLRAARDAGVKRVVLTSSFGAIAYGHAPTTTPFDESTWTDLNNASNPVRPYVKSKTLAERAAWDFVAKEGKGLELSVINPVGVFGPVLSGDYSPSIQIVQRMLDGAMPGCPKLRFAIVDVRDVADAHIRAMTNPAAKGERFISSSSDHMWLRDIARVLKQRMGAAAHRVKARQFPNWLIRIAAKRDPQVEQLTPELSKVRNANNAKATRVLGCTPRSGPDAIVASAESLIKLGLTKDSAGK